MMLRSRVAQKGASFSRLYTTSGNKYPKPLKPKQFGADILHDPLWNKGTAFDSAERDRLGLRGLLPPAIRSLESQVERVMVHVRSLQDDVEKNLYLQSLHNRNETLYHRAVVDYIDEIAPLIYTPTVGGAAHVNDVERRRTRSNLRALL